jgi:hypothetical protein
MNIRVRDSKKGIMQHKTPGFGATEDEIANYGKEEMGRSTTTGWTPGCNCFSNEMRARVKRQMLREVPKFGDIEKNFPDFTSIPCTVLDPFSGAGTTALVAAKLGRDAIGIELNPAYAAMSEKRIKWELGMLADVKMFTQT